MKRLRMRLILVAALLLLTAAIGWVNARHSFPQDVFPCEPCTAACVDDPSAVRTCSQGKYGQSWPATYNCCCCNENWKTRWFHGG